MSDVVTGVAQTRTELLESVASLNASRSNQSAALSRRISHVNDCLVGMPPAEEAALTNRATPGEIRQAGITGNHGQNNQIGYSVPPALRPARPLLTSRACARADTNKCTPPLLLARTADTADVPTARVDT